MKVIDFIVYGRIDRQSGTIFSLHHRSHAKNQLLVQNFHGTKFL